jgi:putative FmdB family regulatory protein
VPLYDFRCRSCGEQFEEYVSVSVTPPCPSCGGAEVERVLTSFAGPFTVGLRGLAAKRSNATRRVREEQRRERREQRREQRRQQGG